MSKIQGLESQVNNERYDEFYCTYMFDDVEVLFFIKVLYICSCNLVP